MGTFYSVIISCFSMLRSLNLKFVSHEVYVHSSCGLPHLILKVWDVGTIILHNCYVLINSSSLSHVNEP